MIRKNSNNFKNGIHHTSVEESTDTLAIASMWGHWSSLCTQCPVKLP